MVEFVNFLSNHDHFPKSNTQMKNSNSNVYRYSIRCILKVIKAEKLKKIIINCYLYCFLIKIITISLTYCRINFHICRIFSIKAV